MKKAGIILLALGLIAVSATILVDWLSSDGKKGFGAFQFFGLEAGIALLLVGLGWLIIKQDEKISIRRQISLLLERPLTWPPLVWTLLTFLALYIPWFLFPLYFSKSQIHYFTKYIPDAYITHIGFDIEAIVSRTQTWLLTGQSPYADGFIAYPPLAIALFVPFILLGYPAYFEFMTVLTLAAYLVASLVIPLLIVPKRSQALVVLLFVTGLFSYGLQFEQERGQFNLIAFTICLWAIYLFHYRPQFRYFAYLLFSLSIQLKVYPVVFAVMFIHDWRDWKNNLRRLLGLGALNFSLLFVLGSSFYRDFIRAITAYQFAYQSSRYENLSIKGFTYYLSTNVFGFETTSKASALLEIFLLTIVGLLLFALLFLAWRRQWRGLNPSLLLGCTVAALVLPSVSNDYKLSLLIAPMILFLSCMPEVKGKNKQIMYIMLLVLISLAYWSVFYPATVKPDFLDRNFPALFLMFISVTALNFLVPYTDDNPSNSIL